nr:uncharacterized protein LOC106687487 [Halyomorpha halys]
MPNLFRNQTKSAEACRFNGATESWQIISADLMGPLPLSRKQNRFILCITNYFSKYSILVPLRQAKGRLVVKHIEKQVFLMFGVPQIIICDNGVQFKSREFKTLMEQYKVTIWFTAYYHPQANPTERVNRVIKSMLTSYVVDNHRTWDKELPKVAFALKTVVHESTGFTPAYINLGREIARSGNDHGVDDGRPKDLCFDRQKHLSKMQKTSEPFEVVRENLNAAYEKSTKVYNLRRRPVDNHVGQSVWCKTHHQSDGAAYFSTKLALKYKKCRIKKVISSIIVELEDLVRGELACPRLKVISSRRVNDCV